MTGSVVPNLDDDFEDQDDDMENLEDEPMEADSDLVSFVKISPVACLRWQKLIRRLIIFLKYTNEIFETEC